ncbi:haloacid dehalogenase [Polychaeton citri CBS 116435]|uniref:Haloacid dehalogenase n=1 Tax=Polychaeton citri CBS 116435 TaxID=1314669 RepID=A0A9P4QBW0_9PEZI|nr:haloacid dehalogenase [Polychaeton citri CBS 116435]
MALKDPTPKCLFFDVFGTCVDWRKTVTDKLYNESSNVLNSPESSISSRIRMRASTMTYEQWGDIAQEWRDSYLVFTRSIANDPSIPYKTVDQHHLDALREILERHSLINPLPPPSSSSIPADDVQDGSLWHNAQVRSLAQIWHYLAPWPDTVRGIQALNRSFSTCSLTNGNLDLIRDMAAHADMQFTHIFSAEMFGSYKPSPKVYLGAAAKLGFEPGQCVMVAAHLDDLKAAKACGFGTVYVERPLEERYPELADEPGVVDVWVGGDEDGFLSAASKLGVRLEE